MAIKGVSMREREDIILTEDPGHPDHAEFKDAVARGIEPPKPTKFFIAPLTKGDRVELGDMGASPTLRDGAVTMDMRNTRRDYATVERSLRGWENLLDDDGNLIPFPQALGTASTGYGMVPVAPPEAMIRLDHDTIAQLAQIIREKNGMTKALMGNLPPPSPQPVEKPFESGAAKDAAKPSKKSEAA
jgi:hypothetical protein